MKKLKKILYRDKKIFYKIFKIKFPERLIPVCAFLNRKVKGGYVNSHIHRLAG